MGVVLYGVRDVIDRAVYLPQKSSMRDVKIDGEVQCIGRSKKMKICVQYEARRRKGGGNHIVQLLAWLEGSLSTAAVHKLPN